MIKLMGVNDPQRAKLIEADEIASRIALAETDARDFGSQRCGEDGDLLRGRRRLPGRR